MVVFVGDQPSRLNRFPDVAFFGSKSWPTLCDWAGRLSLKDYNWYAVNSHTQYDMSRIMDLYRGNESNIIFIALGNDAAKRLGEKKIPYFKLPHPSPRNRKLNDKEYVAKILEECHNYLKENGNV